MTTEEIIGAQSIAFGQRETIHNRHLMNPTELRRLIEGDLESGLQIIALKTEREALRKARVETVEILSKRVAELEQQAVLLNYAADKLANQLSQSYTREQMVEIGKRGIEWGQDHVLNTYEGDWDFVINRILDEMKGKEV